MPCFNDKTFCCCLFEMNVFCKDNFEQRRSRKIKPTSTSIQDTDVVSTRNFPLKTNIPTHSSSQILHNAGSIHIFPFAEDFSRIGSTTQYSMPKLQVSRGEAAVLVTMFWYNYSSPLKLLLVRRAVDPAVFIGSAIHPKRVHDHLSVLVVDAW